MRFRPTAAGTMGHAAVGGWRTSDPGADAKKPPRKVETTVGKETHRPFKRHRTRFVLVDIHSFLSMLLAAL